MRSEGLLAWQWGLYRGGHQDRTNLVIHAVTMPLFVAGVVAACVAPVVASAALGVAGGAAVVLALALQGRGHRREATRPEPFTGPGDVVARLFVEQFVTFPRYVLSGGFARAWRRAGVTATP